MESPGVIQNAGSDSPGIKEGTVIETGGQSDTVLCIGSDALALHFRKRFLKQKGYRVLAASTGNEGLDLFAAEPVDAVVLDYQLDGWGGPLVAGQMRRQRPDVPIIMLSEEDGLPEDARAVVDAVISESSGGESLGSALAAILQGRNGPPFSADPAPPAA